VRLLEGVDGIAHVTFTATDVVRHELVARIVEAYDKGSGAQARAAGMKVPARAAVKIDVLVQSERWRNAKKVKSIVRRAVAKAAAVGRQQEERSLLSF